MVAEILSAVLPSFISTLTHEFLGRRRSSIDVRGLEERVAQLAASQQQLALAATGSRQAIAVLIRYLALSMPNDFRIHNGKVEIINEQLRSDRALRGAIDHFGAAVQHQIRRRQDLQENRRTAGSPTMQEANNDERTRVALDRFFDGFEEEIKRARLGSEEPRQ